MTGVLGREIALVTAQFALALMTQSVLTQCGQQGEPLAALLATVRPLSRVHPRVADQVIALPEAAPTLVTLVRPVLLVSTAMAQEFGQCARPASTRDAHERRTGEVALHVCQILAVGVD